MTLVCRQYSADQHCHLSREKLKIFKQTSGHLRVPFDDNRPRKNPRAAYDPETLQLGKWVKRQRRQYALKQLSQDRIEALEKIGFSFNPGNPTKEEKIEIQLGLLDSLRKRPELTKVQVADLDFVYDQWKGRAKERAPKPIGAARGENKFDAKWTAMFEQLKEFRVSLLHCSLSARRHFLSHDRLLLSLGCAGGERPHTRAAKPESVGEMGRLPERVLLEAPKGREEPDERRQDCPARKDWLRMAHSICNAHEVTRHWGRGSTREKWRSHR